MDEFDYQGVPTNDPTHPAGAAHIFRSTAINCLVECCLGHRAAEDGDLTDTAALHRAREEVADAILEHLEHPGHVHPTWYRVDVAEYIIRDLDRAILVNRNRWKTFIELIIEPGNTLLMVFSVTGPVR